MSKEEKQNEPVRNNEFDDEICPVCGYYCDGNGGFGCIDKPVLTGLRKPPKPEPKDEPMAYLTNHRQRLNITINPVVIKSMPIAVEWEMPLYAKPQAKEWVGLTDEDIEKILSDPNVAEMHRGNWLVLPYLYAREIEAKLKEKNSF